MTRTRRFTASARKSAATSRPGGSGAPESIELIEPVFYRGLNAFIVGRLIGDGSITPIVIAFSNSREGCRSMPS